MTKPHFFRLRAGQGACFFVMLFALNGGHAQARGEVMQFDLPKLDGSALVRLSAVPTGVVVLNFWRSDCPPCIQEMPLLNQQAQRQPGVNFIGIATEEASKAKRFLVRYPSGYLQLRAPSDAQGLMRRFGNKTGALPFTVVLNAQRQGCQATTGLLDERWLAQALLVCSDQDKH
jgi:thiol-disulfide isomerase/thioredoxin